MRLSEITDFNHQPLSRHTKREELATVYGFYSAINHTLLHLFSVPHCLTRRIHATIGTANVVKIISATVAPTSWLTGC